MRTILGHDQGLCHRNALALAAGRLMQIALLESLQSDLGEPGPYLLARFRDRAAMKEPQADIVLGGPPGRQPVLLKHVAGLTVQARKRLAEDANRGPDAPQECEKCTLRSGEALAAPAELCVINANATIVAQRSLAGSRPISALASDFRTTIAAFRASASKRVRMAETERAPRNCP